MAVPELDANRVRKWAHEKTPPEYRDEMRVEVAETPRGLSIFDCRPPWSDLIGPDTEWARFIHHADRQRRAHHGAAHGGGTRLRRLAGGGRADRIHRTRSGDDGGAHEALRLALARLASMAFCFSSGK